MSVTTLHSHGNENYSHGSGNELSVFRRNGNVAVPEISCLIVFVQVSYSVVVFYSVDRMSLWIIFVIISIIIRRFS